jgi:hypothetical protein
VYPSSMRWNEKLISPNSTNDWSLDQKGGTSMDKINISMTKWLTGKSSGVLDG